ncbi:MAG: alpha/beta hydrolase [Bacteroidota bacterium]
MSKRKKIIFIIIIFFTIPISAVFLRPSNIISREKAIQKIAQKDSKFYTWNGTKMHYVDQGKGKVILMIHGLGGSHRNFEKIALELSKDYRVIRIDLPGFGLSEFPKDSMKFMDVYDGFLHSFMQDLQLDSVTLVGNSMGGMVSWVYAYKHPEHIDKLVLMGSAGYDLEAARKQAIQFARFGFVEVLAQKGLPLFITKQAVDRCYYNKDFIKPEEVKKANTFWNIDGNLAVFFTIAHTKEFPDEKWIQQIHKPTLIIWGENDQIAPLKNASKFERDIKHSKKIIYPHCGHLPQNEYTQQLAKDLRAFIENK